MMHLPTQQELCPAIPPIKITSWWHSSLQKQLKILIETSFISNMNPAAYSVKHTGSFCFTDFKCDSRASAGGRWHEGWRCRCREGCWGNHRQGRWTFPSGLGTPKYPVIWLREPRKSYCDHADWPRVEFWVHLRYRNLNFRPGANFPADCLGKEYPYSCAIACRRQGEIRKSWSGYMWVYVRGNNFFEFPPVRLFPRKHDWWVSRISAIGI